MAKALCMAFGYKRTAQYGGVAQNGNKGKKNA